MMFEMLGRGQMAYLDPCAPLDTLLTCSARRPGKCSLGLFSISMEASPLLWALTSVCG